MNEKNSGINIPLVDAGVGLGRGFRSVRITSQAIN
jgi:hypothetical protein